MDNEHYVFILNNQEVLIQKNPYDLSFIKKMPVQINKSLIFNQPYLIQSKIQIKNLEMFLNYLNNANVDLSEMRSNDFFEYYLLKTEFNVDDINEDQNYTEILNESIINNINSTSSFGRIVCEDHISANLDYYINSYGDLLRKIPITSLYNIFVNPKRRLVYHDDAYQFIINSLIDGNNNNKKSFCILLSTLDGTKMSADLLKDSFEKQNERFNYAPKIAPSFFDTIDKKI